MAPSIVKMTPGQKFVDKNSGDSFLALTRFTLISLSLWEPTQR